MYKNSYNPSIVRLEQKGMQKLGMQVDVEKIRILFTQYIYSFRMGKIN